MKIDIIKESKNRIEIKIKGEGHTFCNFLRKELWNDSHVRLAGYNVKHTLLDEILFVVETDGKEKPKSALKKACNRLKKSLSGFKKEVSKLRC